MWRLKPVIIYGINLSQTVRKKSQRAGFQLTKMNTHSDDINIQQLQYIESARLFPFIPCCCDDLTQRVWKGTIQRAPRISRPILWLFCFCICHILAMVNKNRFVPTVNRWKCSVSGVSGECQDTHSGSVYTGRVNAVLCVAALLWRRNWPDVKSCELRWWKWRACVQTLIHHSVLVSWPCHPYSGPRLIRISLFLADSFNMCNVSNYAGILYTLWKADSNYVGTSVLAYPTSPQLSWNFKGSTHKCIAALYRNMVSVIFLPLPRNKFFFILSFFFLVLW